MTDKGYFSIVEGPVGLAGNAMARPFPPEVAEVENWLYRQGLTLRLFEKWEMGTFTRDFANDSIGVRIWCDRGSRWFLNVTDAQSVDDRWGRWFDIAIVRDFLVGPAEDILEFGEQVVLLEKLWPDILRIFDSRNSIATHERLGAMRKDRVRRWFGPGIA